MFHMEQCIYIIPAPSMNKNISYRKYSHNMDTYNVQYVRYTSNRLIRSIWTNMDKLSNMIKLNKDKFFYINLENPAPTCQKLRMEK